MKSKKKLGLKEEMLNIMEQLFASQIDVMYFCRHFEKIYNFSENRNNLTEEEWLNAEHLFDVAALYSPYKEDRKMYPGYTDEKTVLDAAKQTYRIFCKNEKLLGKIHN